MNEEEFLQKIKGIKVNIPDEQFFLEYNAVVYNILKENQQLKEQLELSEKARKEAIEFIKDYEKNQNLLKWNEEDYIDVINEIKKYLDIDKGE